MNELIQELADRAIGSMPRDWIQTHDWNIPDEFLEKFAELIVGECILLCDQVDIVGADECIDNIKQHFGVE